MKDLKIEVGKFYKTRAGDKVRIYAIDGHIKDPIHGAIFIMDGWLANSWEYNGYIRSKQKSDYDIISEWDDKPIFDNWDALPAWCDYAIAMDNTGKWHCYESIPRIGSNCREDYMFWYVDKAGSLKYMIGENYMPKNYKGDWEDSLLINPKYLKRQSK